MSVAIKHMMFWSHLSQRADPSVPAPGPGSVRWRGAADSLSGAVLRWQRSESVVREPGLREKTEELAAMGLDAFEKEAGAVGSGLLV